jgi:hypothetical protein
MLSSQHEAILLLYGYTMSLLEVTLLSRKKWTRRPGILPDVKGLLCYTDGPWTPGGGAGFGAWVYGQSLGRRLNISLRIYATYFQAEIYDILACAFEIRTNHTPEKYVSIYSCRQAALKALQFAVTTYLLVQQCQNALNDVSTHNSVGLFWVPGNSGTRGNEIADGFVREGTVQQFFLDRNLPWGSLGRLQEER